MIQTHKLGALHRRHQLSTASNWISGWVAPKVRYSHHKLPEVRPIKRARDNEATNRHWLIDFEYWHMKVACVQRANILWWARFKFQPIMTHIIRPPEAARQLSLGGNDQYVFSEHLSQITSVFSSWYQVTFPLPVETSVFETKSLSLPACGITIALKDVSLALLSPYSGLYVKLFCDKMRFDKLKQNKPTEWEVWLAVSSRTTADSP